MPALAIGAVLIAFVAALVLLAVAAFAPFVGQLVPNVPLIGGAIRSLVSNAFAGAARVIGYAVDAFLIPLDFLVMGTAIILWWLAYAASASVTRAHALAWYGINLANILYNRAVAYAYSLALTAGQIAAGFLTIAEQFAQGLYNAAVEVAEDLNDALWGLVLAIEVELEGFIRNVFTDAARYINSLVAPLAQRVTNVELMLEGDISSVYNKLANEINGAVGLAEHEVAVATQQLETYAQAVATAASGGAITTIDKAAADVVNPALAALLPALGTIAGSLPANVAAELHLPDLEHVGSVAGVVAGLGLLAPTVAAVATEVAECGVPLCRNLSGLSGLVGELTDAGLLAALLALLAEAAHDPEAAISTVESFYAGPVVAAADTAKSLLRI